MDLVLVYIYNFTVIHVVIFVNRYSAYPAAVCLFEKVHHVCCCKCRRTVRGC